MASAIHFKMKSEKDFSTLSFDGDFLKVSDLKLLVVEKRKLNYGDGFDLVITDAQTNEEYADESTLIPKNTSVVIKRVPGQKPGGILSQQTLARRNERYAEKDLAKNNNNNNKNSTSVESSSGDKTKHGGNNISSSGGDQPRQVAGEGEDERIHSVVDSSTITYSQRPRFTQHNPVFDRPPPPNYRCHRCGKPGHWIHHCPTNGDPNFDIVRVRRPTGIPRSMLQSVEAPVRGTGLRTPGGEFVTLKPNQDEFSRRTAALRRMVEQRQGAGSSDSETGNVDDASRLPTVKDSHDDNENYLVTGKQESKKDEETEVIGNEFVENKSYYQEQESTNNVQVGGSMNASDLSQSIVNSIGSRRREDRESDATPSASVSLDNGNSVSKDMKDMGNKEVHRDFSSTDQEQVTLQERVGTFHRMEPPEIGESLRGGNAPAHVENVVEPSNHFSYPSFFPENMPFPTGYPPPMTPGVWPYPYFPFPYFGQSFAPINNDYSTNNNIPWKDSSVVSASKPNLVEKPKDNESSMKRKHHGGEDDRTARSSSPEQTAEFRRRHSSKRGKQKR